MASFDCHNNGQILGVWMLLEGFGKMGGKPFFSVVTRGWGMNLSDPISH